LGSCGEVARRRSKGSLNSRSKHISTREILMISCRADL